MCCANGPTPSLPEPCRVAKAVWRLLFWVALAAQNGSSSKGGIDMAMPQILSVLYKYLAMPLIPSFPPKQVSDGVRVGVESWEKHCRHLEPTPLICCSNAELHGKALEASNANSFSSSFTLPVERMTCLVSLFPKPKPKT